MECTYQIVNNRSSEKIDRHDWKSFLRQVHVNSGVWTMFFMAGLCSGAPTVFLPQLSREGNGIIDDELASWLYSVSNIMSIPWVLILPSFTRWTGRKPVYIMTCLAISAVFIMLYFSTTPYQILAAGVVQGFVNASNVTVMTMIQNEYSSPKYRGVFLNITSASFFWGIWTSNAIGTYFYWKYIAVLGIICSAYTFSIAFGPESPIWLANKGKFEKSKEAFTWLHGLSEESKKELHDLIISQTEYHTSDADNKTTESLKVSLRRKEFYKPLLLCVAVGAQYSFSGKIVCSAYAIEVLSKMTSSQEAAHLGMLILDGVTILGMYFGSFLSKILKRRTLFLTSAFTGVTFIFLISLHIYLVKLSVLAENNLITILLLVSYSLSISCGSVVMCIALYSEIIPLRYQTISYMVISLCFLGSTSVLLKLAPMAFKYLGIHGSFLFCGVTCGGFTVILYIYLPETKGKTLLEIEEYFKDKRQKDREAVDLKQNKQLMNAT